MAGNGAKKLFLSKESAQFLLEGLRFFQKNPQAKEWHGLDKDTFFLLARDIAQFYPDEEENLTEYLVRFEAFLQRIINNEELAPSIPQNLEELVNAFEAFQKEKNADVKAKEIGLPTSQDITLEDWIKNLQEKHAIQRIRKEIEEKAVFLALSEQQKEETKENLAEKLVTIIPKTVIPSKEEEKQAAEEIKQIVNQGTASLILKEKESLRQAIAQEIRFLTVPPVTTKPPISPEEESLIKAVTQAVQNKTPLKNPAQIQIAAQKIAQGLAQKVPRLTAQEKAALTEIEKISLTEEVVNASLPEIVEAITESKTIEAKGASSFQENKFVQRLIKKVSQQENSSIIYSTQAPNSSKEAIIKMSVQPIVADLIPPVEKPSDLEEISKTISQTILPRLPALKEEDLAALPEETKTSFLKNAIQEALPEITQTIQTGEVSASLNPEESQEFLKELTNQTKQPLLDFAVSLREELETASLNLPQTKGNQEGAVFNQLNQNPLLPYQLAPQETQTPLGLQMRQVAEHYGLNQKSAEIISYQNEEVAGLTNSITGKTSTWWQNQINRLRASGEDKSKIPQAVKNFNLQTKFETNFAQLANFYQKAVSWPKVQGWFGQITRPVTSFFKEKAGRWWQGTAIAKSLTKGAQSKISLFFKKTLSSFNVFKAGAKKTLQEGAKKGATKAVSWLTTKLAATKLGAALGSVAPGIGNAVGAVIGFGIDILKSGLNIFANTLQKITGGETEAERTIKANLGPLGKIAFSPITLIIIGVPILILVLALNLFQTEGSAFILDEEAISGLPFSSLPSETPITDNHLAERLVQILQDCPATKPNGYINRSNFSQVAQCLSDAGINSDVINILEESASRFSSLQCVGFVRAVEAGLGRTLPSCGNAKDYYSCQAVKEDNSNYEYANCQNLKTGAIGVFTGGTYGHVGIITAVEPSDGGIIRVRFASAWGTSTENGGRVTITTMPCDSFATLIQPKN